MVASQARGRRREEESGVLVVVLGVMKVDFGSGGAKLVVKVEDDDWEEGDDGDGDGN